MHVTLSHLWQSYNCTLLRFVLQTANMHGVPVVLTHAAAPLTSLTLLMTPKMNGTTNDITIVARMFIRDSSNNNNNHKNNNNSNNNDKNTDNDNNDIDSCFDYGTSNSNNNTNNDNDNIDTHTNNNDNDNINTNKNSYRVITVNAIARNTKTILQK